MALRWVGASGANSQRKNGREWARQVGVGFYGMNGISFIVDALPIAQPRPQPVKRGNRAMMANVARSHPVYDYKASVRLCYQQAGGVLHDGPLGLWLTFVMPRPKNMIWKTKPMPRTWYTAHRNDFDNLAKSFVDALNTVAWRDDGQIAWANVQRLIAAGQEAPHVEARLEPLGRVGMNGI